MGYRLGMELPLILLNVVIHVFGLAYIYDAFTFLLREIKVRVPQQTGDGRVIRHDKGGQKLRHVGHAAPFVTSEESDGYGVLGQRVAVAHQAERDVATFGFIQSS